MYGRPSRERLPERNEEPSLGQALHMLAGFTYSEKPAQQGSRLGGLLDAGASDREIIKEFYLAAPTRFPAENELQRLEQLVATKASRDKAFSDFLWAMIASREFSYNH